MAALFAQVANISVGWIIGGVVILLLIGWFVLSYNRLVRLRNLMREAWSGIDVQLKRRHDLIPNLVEVVKGYAKFEHDVFTEVTSLRCAASDQSIAERQKDENALTGSLRKLFAVAEAYPELMANKSFLDLQHQLSETEDELQMARRYYNATVRDYNTRVESIPSNLVAAVFRFPTAPFFELETVTERAAPKVELS